MARSTLRSATPRTFTHDRWHTNLAPPQVERRKLVPRAAKPSPAPDVLDSRAIASAQERYFEEWDARHRARTRAPKLTEF